MRAKKATHFAVYIAAQIHGLGFEDMLRYDNCCPASEVESCRLEHAAHGNGAEWVVFRRFVPAGAKPEPTVARWRSFGITCLPKVFDEYHAAVDALVVGDMRKD